MRRLFAALASTLGLATSAASETKMVDPRELLFSLPTINDALPSIDASATREQALVIHEDDWRQFEAVSATFRDLIDAELSDVRAIYAQHSRRTGEFRAFTKIHIRNRLPTPLKQPLSWPELLVAAGIPPADVVPVALRDGQGAIRGGFSFRIGSLTAFGQRDSDSVYTLCFVPTRTPGIDAKTAERFAKFLSDGGFLLIHWPSATVIDGQASLEFLTQKNNGG